MGESTSWTLVKTWIFPLLLILVVASLVRNKYKPGLSDIPGPQVAAYTKLWRLYDVWKGQSHWTAIRLHKKYGKLVRIAPGVVSVGDAGEIPKLYNVKGDYTKTGFYPIQSISWKKKPQMNLFSTRSEAEHREERKKIANAYSLESLIKMEDTIDDCGRLFIEKMREYADQGKAVDLGAWLQYYGIQMRVVPTFAR